MIGYCQDPVLKGNLVLHCQSGRLVLIFLLLSIPLTALAATSPFLMDRQPDGRWGFGYRFQHPHFAGDVAADFFMGFHELSVEAPLSDQLVVALAVPMYKWGFDSTNEPDDKLIFGNVSLGAHVLKLGARQNMSLAITVQLPTAQDSADHLAVLGLLSHPSVWQTFLPDILTLQTHFAARIPAAGEGFVRLEFGPDVLFPTGDSNDSPVVHLRYGVGVGVATRRVGASIEFAGFWETDGDGDDFSENSAHVLAAGVEYAGGVVRPALYYEIATDEIFDSTLDGVLGLRFTIKPR